MQYLAILARSGKLRKNFLPAIWFDASVLIGYRGTEDMEMAATKIDELILYIL